MNGGKSTQPGAHREATVATAAIHRRVKSGLITTLTAALALLCGVAAAHDRGISYSTWSIHGREAYVTVRLSELELSYLPASGETDAGRDRDLGTYLTQRLRLVAGDNACGIVDGPRRLDAPAGRAVYEWRM